MRWPRRRPWPPAIRASTRSCCAPRTRISPSACWTTASSSSIGARARCDAAAVRQKFGVPPRSIPDWLALVGDRPDGYPGLPGWGARSAATVLARYEHLEQIPKLALEWEVAVRGAMRLATTLMEQRERALLFRELATLRVDAPLGVDVDGLHWTGPQPEF